MRLLSLTCCFALVMLATSFARADEPAGVTKLKNTIEGDAKAICRISHPLGKYQNIKLDSYKASGPTHTLVYTISWEGKEDKVVKDFLTTLQFDFGLADNGDVEKLTLKVLKDTCPHAPFKAGKLLVMPFRVQAKKYMKELSDKPEDMERVEKLEADALLAFWLQYKANKGEKSED